MRTETDRATQRKAEGAAERERNASVITGGNRSQQQKNTTLERNSRNDGTRGYESSCVRSATPIFTQCLLECALDMGRDIIITKFVE